MVKLQPCLSGDRTPAKKPRFDAYGDDEKLELQKAYNLYGNNYRQLKEHMSSNSALFSPHARGICLKHLRIFFCFLSVILQKIVALLSRYDITVQFILEKQVPQKQNPGSTIKGSAKVNTFTNFLGNISV